jgi:hypothetical protein
MAHMRDGVKGLDETVRKRQSEAFEEKNRTK